MTVALELIGQYADTLLESGSTGDYPNALNGIQFENRSAIKGIASAVDFSSRSIDEPVYFLIAERKQLREFLMKHYPVPNFIAQYAANMS